MNEWSRPHNDDAIRLTQLDEAYLKLRGMRGGHDFSGRLDTMRSIKVEMDRLKERMGVPIR